MEIRRIRPDDWRTLRELRLRALATDPDAFASTLDREREHEAEWWQEWAGDDAAGTTDATYLAWDGGAAVGMAAGLARYATAGVIVVAMWVAPEARRGGTGRALLEAVEDWARDVGAATTSLSVTNVNPGAQRFYEACGYVATGETQALARDSRVTEITLRKVLAA